MEYFDMANSPELNYIDIFAGCGGLSLGLYNAGWKGLFAIEKNEMAFATLKHNLIDNKHHFDWPDWLPQSPHDINKILVNNRSDLKALKGKVDLVAGGPPCQGFSYAGKRDERDHRNQLVNSYIEFVRLVKPRMVFFENVRGFTSKFIQKPTDGKKYSDIVIGRLAELGYDVKPNIIDFSNYGVPQRRKRFILVGMQDSDAKIFFERLDHKKRSFLKKKKLPYSVTVSEAISDLERRNGDIDSPDSNNFMAGVYGSPKSAYQTFMRDSYQKPYPDSHRFVNHKIKTIEKFKYFIETAPKNKNLPSDTKKRFNLRKKCITLLDPDQPSPTLTTLTDDYIHYNEPRVLTVREFARLQSFNEWFEFREKYTTGGKFRISEVPRYTQVGNAIPPLFVEQAGHIMKAMI
jgi:DNA (cytosine-5)-methyltransferase 1